MHDDAKSDQSAQSSDANPIYEMLWDCEYCGSKKLLGKTQRFCPECGAGQDPDRRYYPADNEKIAVHNHHYVGADKSCPACDHPNSGNSEYCTQCGSPMDAAKVVDTRTEQMRTEREQFARGENKKHSQKAASQAPSAPPPAPAKAKKRFWLAVIISLIAVLVFSLFFWTKEVAVEATGFSWQRLIYIDNYAPRSEGTWCNGLPRDAYQVKRERKIRDYKQIPDGQSCQTKRIDQGDGTYREQQVCKTKYRKEPIYDQYCRYKVDKWASHRSAIAKGKDKRPYWPKANLRCEGQRRVGCERERSRETAYLVQLIDTQSRKTYECELGEDIWERGQVGSYWQLKVSAVTGGERCGSLVPVAGY